MSRSRGINYSKFLLLSAVNEPYTKINKLLGMSSQDDDCIIKALKEFEEKAFLRTICIPVLFFRFVWLNWTNDGVKQAEEALVWRQSFACRVLIVTWRVHVTWYAKVCPAQSKHPGWLSLEGHRSVTVRANSEQSGGFGFFKVSGHKTVEVKQKHVTSGYGWLKMLGAQSNKIEGEGG